MFVLTWFVCLFVCLFVLTSQASYFSIRNYVGIFVQIFHLKVIGKDKIVNVFLDNIVY